MLKARIERLEQRARERTAAKPAVTVNDPAEGAKLEQFSALLAMSPYRDWRHEPLSFEQLLALARDDCKREPSAQRLARAAREIEIRILLRDGKTDEAEASALRANADAHFGLLGGDDHSSLTALPFPMEFDEGKALRAARAQCPFRESLALERQLEMHEEDHAHELQERGRRPERLMDRSMDAVNDKMYEIRLRELQEKICERDTRAVAATQTIDA